MSRRSTVHGQEVSKPKAEGEGGVHAKCRVGVQEGPSALQTRLLPLDVLLLCK